MAAQTMKRTCVCAVLSVIVHKGPNLSSIDPETGNVTPLFNPRLQTWNEHFVLEGVHIKGLTPEDEQQSFYYS
jgi:hypothetical protein